MSSLRSESAHNTPLNFHSQKRLYNFVPRPKVAALRPVNDKDDEIAAKYNWLRKRIEQSLS